MQQWPVGKSAQKVVVYPIPRQTWENKADATNEYVQENNGSEYEAARIIDHRIKKSLSLLQVDGSSEKRFIDNEFNSLKEQLDSQLKVNSDLKKLLIASLGDDLHYKVDVLVRTKAHLTNEVSTCTNKMIEDFENIDKLTVETDLWRTKFQASCVLLNLLTSEKNKMNEAFIKSQTSLQELLDERRHLNSRLVQTNNYLNSIDSTLFPLQRNNNQQQNEDHLESKNTMELAESVNNLVVKIHDVLHISRRPNSPLPSPSRGLTFAEALATKVLSNDSQDSSSITSDICSIVQSSKALMGMTFNCCRRCKGQIWNI